MEILKVENLTKIYGKNSTEVKALDNVSFSVNKGEFLAIVGASGSGKSTLLHLLGGVDKPTSGKVFIEGQDIYSFNEDKLAIFRRRQIGLIYQFYNLIPILNVTENITLPLDLDNRAADQDELTNLIKLLGLEKRTNHLPNELSGGQQQRVSIARALVYEPEVIYFDEPTSALDPELIGEVLTTMKQLAESGMTMVVVTHELSFAKNISNKVLFLDKGEVIENTDSKSFFENPTNDRVKQFLKSISERV